MFYTTLLDCHITSKLPVIAKEDKSERASPNFTALCIALISISTNFQRD